MVEAVDTVVCIRAFAVLADLKQVHGRATDPSHDPREGIRARRRPRPLPRPAGYLQASDTSRTSRSASQRCHPVPGKPRPDSDNIGETGVSAIASRGADLQHRVNADFGWRWSVRHRHLLSTASSRASTNRRGPSISSATHPAQLTFWSWWMTPVVPSTVFQIEDPVGEDARRRYITTMVQRRPHQKGFQERASYRCISGDVPCASPEDVELLEAAHILSDTHPRGEFPIVRNGLRALRAASRAAGSDAHILGITRNGRSTFPTPTYSRRDRRPHARSRPPGFSGARDPNAA